MGESGEAWMASPNGSSTARSLERATTAGAMCWLPSNLKRSGTGLKIAGRESLIE